MKQQLFSILVMLFITALILAVSPTIVFCLPDNPIGKVVALRGKVIAVQSNSNFRTLELKSPVFLQDTIKTTQGRTQLMFDDNTLITLGRNTEMIIKEYQWKAGDPDSGIKTQIRAGSFRVMGGAITRDAPKNFITQTPAATIGIRGSMYAGLVQGKSLTLVFQGGKSIYVTNRMGRVDIDRPGYGTIVKNAAKAPAKPAKMDKKALQKIEGELAVNAKETEEKTDQESDSQTQLADLDMEGSEETLENPAPDNTIDNIKMTVAQDTEEITDSAQIDSIISGTIPSTGIWTYTGTLQDTTDATDKENVTVTVNWDNKRFLAIEEDPDHPDNATHGFAFGEVTDSGEIINVVVLGTDDYDNSGQIRTMTGSETSGQIYGSAQESAIINLEGHDIDIQNQTIQKAWSDTVEVSVDTKASNSNSGTATWNGFFTGVGEDMDDPDTDRVAFANEDSSDFKMTVNKDDGTFSGSMSGDDFLGSTNQINSITLGGGKTKSVYISDDKLAGILDGTISNSSGSSNLKTYGNFMISSMETQLSDNTNWGYWEAAYEEAGTGKDFHIHDPGAFWIAGAQTPASAVQSLISSNFSATYEGGAQGVKFDSSGQMTSLTNGQTSLTIEFGSGTYTPVHGTISFDEKTLDVESSTLVNNLGFSGSITDAESGSMVNGTFFGDNAQGIGGNFSATFTNGATTTYQGIFAGDR
ncbi:MAG: FecR domain-containing protein [Desulfobacteraceae bacterium]|nr:FecR domain-containing protein [Desulfobacteraceae bacterium]